LAELSKIALQLGLDPTFYWILGTFVAFFIISEILFIQPFQRLLLARRTAAKNITVSSDRLKEIEQKLEQYNKELHGARIEGAKKYEESARLAQAEQEKALATLRDELKREYQSLSTKLAAEKAKAQQDLNAQIEVLSADLADRMIGGK
jgi:F-type H+-transporting ATPase subunit b